MITIRLAADRGHTELDWLDSYHSFSFGKYFDKEFMGFGVLRVLNQDRVDPRTGFEPHDHEDMEILSYILEGTLVHKDSMGNGFKLVAGDVQLMSAGTGIRHSEANSSETEELNFIQVWILPDERRTDPRYEEKQFSKSERQGCLCLIASPDGRNASLTIRQDIMVYASCLDAGETASLDLGDKRRAWLHVARGELSLNDHNLGPGDGVAICDEKHLWFAGLDDAEFLLFDLE